MIYEVRWMGGRPVTETTKEEMLLHWLEGMLVPRIALLCHVSQSSVTRFCKDVPRPPCGCGRRGGHKGHCHMRAAADPAVAIALTGLLRSRVWWTQVADDLLRVDYPGGVDMDVMAAKAGKLLGIRVTSVAIASRVARLGLYRPPGYLALLRGRGIMGRQKGTKNKQPWKRTGPLFRGANGRYVNNASPGAVLVPPMSIFAPSNEVAKSDMAPTARSAPSAGWSMLSMRGPDPRREAWLSDRAQSSKGKV